MTAAAASIFLDDEGEAGDTLDHLGSVPGDGPKGGRGGPGKDSKLIKCEICGEFGKKASNSKSIGYIYICFKKNPLSLFQEKPFKHAVCSLL